MPLESRRWNLLAGWPAAQFRPAPERYFQDSTQRARRNVLQVTVGDSAKVLLTVTDSRPSFPFADITIRVRYFETDQMKVAHHAHYFVWFELARSEFCRKYGIDYGAMEEAGFFLPVVEARCRYKLPARYDDEITVRAEVVERTRKTLRIVYRVSRGTVLLAQAETLQMLVDSSGRPRSFPDEIATRFDGAIQS